MLHKNQEKATDRRLIEETFPIKEVSVESAKEKSIRHGHISTLHIWWARRPLAASRATIYASFISDIAKEYPRKRDFIIELAKWKSSLNIDLISRARKEILTANNGEPPKVLDPFAGGGSIPLEASRLGCQVYSSDYNPISILIQKCTLEYPQKYGLTHMPQVEKELIVESANSLINDVRKWSNWVLEEAKKEIMRFYPSNRIDGSVPVGYIWARTINCQNPSCNAEIPLVRQYWLVRRNDRSVAFYPLVSNKSIEFQIVGTGYDKMPKNFDPDKGTISRAVATCLVCGSVVDNKTTANLFRQNKSSQRMIAVISNEKGVPGKRYRVANSDDLKTFINSEKYLEKKRESLMGEWGIDPVPDEPTPEGKGRGAERAFSVRNYNMNTWGDLFNSRQKLALIVFTEKVRKVYSEMLQEGYADDYAKAVTSYLSVILNRLADKAASLVVYHVTGEKVEHVFGRQALGMVWDYVEVNPFTDVGWPNMQEWVERVIDHCSQLPKLGGSPLQSVTIKQSSATELSYPNNFFDAVMTDPPYYDNIPYSYLSDFFYVWAKRSIGHLYPELFSTPLTPKSKEIVAYSNKEGGWEAGKIFFEDMLRKSFMEMYRVLKPNGIAVIVYAHKSTAGWETLLNSLLDSGLVVTAAWPINTELKERLRATDSAALASSIYMIARKLQRERTGFYREVKSELKNHLNQKLDRLWNEGIAGADFFISAIGSSIEVFGKYEKIIDDEGTVIRAARFLELVRTTVTDYAIHQILHNGFAAEISQMTRFYILWRWSYGEAAVPFDDARKLAQSIGIDLAHEWNKKESFIQKDKEVIRVLGPEERNNADELVNSKEIIDILHGVLLLWKKGKRERMIKILKDTGYGKNDIFYRVAQAISESRLSNTSKEKKLLEGFLAGKTRLSEEVRKGSQQKRLFEEE